MLLLAKIDQKCDRESAHRQTDTHAHQIELIICPMLYAIAMGHYYKIIGHVTHTTVRTCYMHLSRVIVYIAYFLFSG